MSQHGRWLGRGFRPRPHGLKELTDSTPQTLHFREKAQEKKGKNGKISVKRKGKGREKETHTGEVAPIAQGGGDKRA